MKDATRMDTESPKKVAVITRTRNRPIMLRRALASITGQSFRDFTWVVVDDGSTEPYAEASVAAATSAGIAARLVALTRSQGMEHASNAAIRSCRSDYLVIHDDDDSWHPGFLAATAAVLDAAPRLAGVVTNSIRITEEIGGDTITPLKTQPHLPRLQSIAITDLAQRNLYPPIAFLFRRSVYDKAGGFDESMQILGDWDFNLKAALTGDIAVIAEALANYHVRAAAGAAGGDYVNSLVPGHARQKIAEVEYRNRKLREDMASGRLGLGHLLALGSLRPAPARKTVVQRLLGGLRRRP